MVQARPVSRVDDRTSRLARPPGVTVSPKVTTDDSKDRRARFGQAQAAVRTKAARVVRIVFGVLATVLALGAVLVVLGSNINKDNSIVELVINVAEAVSGPFSRTDG